jgi:hypothetical protein
MYPAKFWQEIEIPNFFNIEKKDFSYPDSNNQQQYNLLTLASYGDCVFHTQQ